MSFEADLSERATDELHAEGVYFGHGAPQSAQKGHPIHRIVVDAGSEPVAVKAAEDLVKAVGGNGTHFEVVGDGFATVSFPPESP